MIYIYIYIYFDRSIEHLTNFASAEDWYQVAAGILGFDTSKLGRHISNESIYEIRNNFRGDIWGYNAPGVITRVLKRICLTENVMYIIYILYYKLFLFNDIRYKF